MNIRDLTKEQIEKIKNCKTVEERQALMISPLASTYEWLAFFTSRAAVLNCNQLVRQYAWEY
jgi:hypothetical protein